MIHPWTVKALPTPCLPGENRWRVSSAVSHTAPMIENPGRTVSALVSHDGELLGSVGPFSVQSPYWNHVEPVAAELTAVLGVPTVVLRLLDVDGGAEGCGGHTSYHAEALRRPAGQLSPAAPDALAPHPKRADWATPEGVREAIGWAQAELRDAGRSPSDRSSR